jgi:hypothetical protein
MGVTWYCTLREMYEAVVDGGCTRDGANKKYVLNL